MSTRRFTRLTNAFSKKFENHAHAIALRYMYYNFCKSAMHSGNVTSKLWEIEDIVNLFPAPVAK